MADADQANPTAAETLEAQAPNVAVPQQTSGQPAQDAVSNKKKGNKIAIGVAVAIVVVIIALVANSMIQAENEKARYNEYVDTLHAAQSAMLKGGAEAEDLADLTMDVWHNAIFD